MSAPHAHKIANAICVETTTSQFARNATKVLESITAQTFVFHAPRMKIVRSVTLEGTSSACNVTSSMGFLIPKSDISKNYAMNAWMISVIFAPKTI